MPDKIKEFFKDKKKRNSFVSIMIGIILVIGFIIFQNVSEKPEKQSITTFMNFLEKKEAKNVENMVIIEDSNLIKYTFEEKEFEVKVPKYFFSEDPEMLKTLQKNDIEVEFKGSVSKIIGNFGEVFRVLIFLIIFYFIFKMLTDSFGGLEVKETKNEKTTFKDIAGYEYVKDELKEIVDFLKNPREYEKYTKQVPKGVLLEGPPGNGKTLMAKAVSGETELPFFPISAGDIEDKYVGSGAKRVEKIFKIVRKRAEEAGGAILFIDEIDAVGMKRESRTVAETNQTINKLLTEMDGFNKETKIIIIAATNLSTILDSALTRAGRFDRIIRIEKPSLEERQAVIELYLNKKNDLIHNEIYDENYSYVLAQQTEGFTNADLDKLINEASLIAKKKKVEKIDIKTLREGFTKVVAGVQTNRNVSIEDKRIIAYHEAGHATAQIMTSPNGYKGVAYITITPHGNSLGHVSPVRGDKVLLKKSDIENEIKVTLAGRAVEQRILNGDYTTGAAGDLQQANKLLLSYVSKYGMAKELENLFIEELKEDTKIVQEQTKLVRDRIYKETIGLIEEHFDVVEKIAEHLLVKTSIEQHELSSILEGTTYQNKFKTDL